MSAKLRGQEARIFVSVEGQPQKGSWFKVTDFTVRPRQDIVEDDYLGEDETDLDFQHHGYDVSFTCHQVDASQEQYLQDLVDNEKQHRRPLRVTITVLYTYREPGAGGRAAVYHSGLLKMNESGFKGRKERVSVEMDGKFKTRELIAA